MNKIDNMISVVGFFFLLTSCSQTPDLVVTNLDVDWNVPNKKAEAVISNQGNANAENFMVYFNGDEDPESQNRRPQIRHNISVLGQGQSITLEADFAPLAHPDNANLGRIYQITVQADPKQMVDESDETNNNASRPVTEPTLELYDKNNLLVPDSPQPISGNKTPILFVHGHNLNSATDNDFNYRKNWQYPLDYSVVLKQPSFKIALDLPQNAALNLEPYYIRFQDQHRSITEDANSIDLAIKRILQRHNDPQATQIKVVMVAYSKGTISSRWYLKNLMPSTQPVSGFIAIASPNHGLASNASNLASRQLNNGYDPDCNSYNEIQSLDFISDLNGHPITDSMTDSQQQGAYIGEAVNNRPNNTLIDEGVLYVSLYANGNRDFVGGDTPSTDCQGRVMAKNLAPNAVNREISEIPGFTAAGAHANTVHTPEVICIALHTAVHHQVPSENFTCPMENVDGRRVPIIP